MSNYNIKLFFDTTEIDITPLMISIKKDESLFKSLKPNTNTVTIELARDNTLYGNLLTWNGDIRCTILKDGNPYFLGFVSPTFKQSIKAGYGLEKTSIQIEDVGIKYLQRVMKDSVVWSGYQICNPSIPAQSIVHHILNLAGVTLFNLPTISVTLPFYSYSFDEKKTYWELLETLLYEYCYTFYFNDSGVFCLFKWNEAAITGVDVWDSTTGLRNNLEYNKTREDFSKVSIKWDSLTYMENIKVFEDTEGGDDTNACNIEVQPSSAYPKDSNTKTVFSEYKSDSYTIKGVINASLSVIQSGLTLFSALVNYGTKAIFSYVNNTGNVATITKSQMFGNAYVLGSSNTSEMDIQTIAGRDSKELEYTASYLYDTVNVLNLLNGLRNYYKYADTKINVSAKEDVAIGTIVKIFDNTFTNSQIYVRVISKISDSKKAGSFIYSCEGIGEYTSEAEDASYVIVNTVKPIPLVKSDLPAVISGIIINNEIVEGIVYANGAGEFTSIPSVPVLSYKGAFRGISLYWTQQPNLTKFQRIELQVSNDNVNWYGLSQDGVSYNNPTLNSYTALESDTGFYVHSLPASSNLWTLYYRARRTTKTDVSSAYSTVITASSSLIQNGDIAANTIDVNKLNANVINTAMLQATKSIVVGTSGICSLSSGDLPPAYDSTRTIINQGTITIDKLVKQTTIVSNLDAEDTISEEFSLCSMSNPSNGEVNKNGFFYRLMFDGASSTPGGKLYLYTYKYWSSAKYELYSKLLLKTSTAAGFYTYAIWSQLYSVGDYLIAITATDGYLNPKAILIKDNTVLDEIEFYVKEIDGQNTIQAGGLLTGGTSFRATTLNTSSLLVAYSYTENTISIYGIRLKNLYIVDGKLYLSTYLHKQSFGTTSVIYSFGTMENEYALLLRGKDIDSNYAYMITLSNNVPTIFSALGEAFLSTKVSFRSFRPIATNTFIELYANQDAYPSYRVITYNTSTHLPTYGAITNFVINQGFPIKGCNYSNDVVLYTPDATYKYFAYFQPIGTYCNTAPTMYISKWTLSGTTLTFVSLSTITVSDYNSTNVYKIHSLTSDSNYGCILHYYNAANTSLKLLRFGYTGYWQTFTTANAAGLTATIINATTVNTPSLRALKKDIQAFTKDALELINSIDVVEYKYISDSSNEPHIGFIADDTPSEMSGVKKNCMKLSDTIGVLLKAVQELSSRLYILENR